jgi:predicted O-linked N-acetylglucosamine transferase (SPINDLY family)
VIADPGAALARAIELHRAGRSAEAESLCEEILAGAPGDARSLHLLGAIRFAGGKVAEAIGLVERAVAAKPDYAEAEFNLGAMLTATGRLVEAAEHFGRAVALRPDHVEAHARLAATLLNIGRYEAAEGAFRRLLALRPDDPPALIDLAALMLTRGDAVAAIEVSHRAVALAPDFALAHVRLGDALRQSEHDPDAIAAYRRAVALAPDSAEVVNPLITALRENFQLAEAEELACRTIARSPDNVQAVHDLALILLVQGKAAEAVAMAQRAVDLAPELPRSRRLLMTTLLYVPDLSPDERFARHVEGGRAMATQVVRRLPPPNDRDPGRRLRIGWLSSDFHTHPVGRNLEGLFRHIDRTKFELIGYAHVPQPNPVTEWFRGQADLWRSIVGRDDNEVAEQIRADRVDVMIYLAGRFDHNRPQVAAWRAAPVQVSFHDPATSGLPEMDYLIADPVLVPRRASERFSERVVRLPYFSIQPPIPLAPAVGQPPCQANGYPTFGSFNNPAKLSSNALVLWAEVLRRRPDARLLLRYHEAFADAGIMSRLRHELGSDLMTRVQVDVESRPLAEHLDLYRRVDVALDPFPFSGSTTTFEALWMGVPVVTLLGDTMVGRWSASMLRALKLGELIARTPEEYAAIALRLAGDPGRLAQLRASSRERVLASPLCDGARFTHHFERLIRALWRRWCRVERP